MNLQESIHRIKEMIGILTEQNSNSYDAVLVGGLDYRQGDYQIDQQVELFKKGFGANKRVKGFRYNTPTSTIADFMNANPMIPVFLFSAGCTKSLELTKNKNVDKSKIYVIEPFAASANTKKIVANAVSNGIPSKNVYVGNSAGRGQGVVDGASSSNSNSHWGALTNVGSMKSNVVSSSGDNEKIPAADTSTAVSSDVDKLDVKGFQSWLDKNHPGWHKKYGTLNNDEGKGWGIFGPNTKRAWANMTWRQEYQKTK